MFEDHDKVRLHEEKTWMIICNVSYQVCRLEILVAISDYWIQQSDWSTDGAG